MGKASAGPGTALQRYAQHFRCCEINSTFYRRHRPETYARWVSEVPAGFRFLLKVPKTITHAQRLQDCEPLLDEFLEDSSALGAARAVLLVQLPPSLAYEAAVAERFFASFRDACQDGIACEPRHPSWFAPEVDDLWQRHRVTRVAADPAPASEQAGEPGGWPGFSYWRWHGSPRVYYSAYEWCQLQFLAAEAQAQSGDCYCIFDNTAAGEATRNALALLDEID